jgi:multidrug efflux system outer membrane protein
MLRIWECIRMNKPLFLRTLPALAATALLAGCSLIPSLERPAAPVATQWADAPRASAAATPAPDLDWQDFVGDAQLREVIRLALANNRDLRVAVLNIEQTRAQYQIRRADQLPTVNAAITGSRQSTSELDKSVNSSFTGGLLIPSSAAWELDFFGRLGSLKEAALAQYLATEEARKAAQISLVASVASTWLSLQTNTELLALAQRTLATREDSLRLTRLRFENGASSALDLSQAESLAAAARASLAQQQRLRAQDVNALTLLVGQTVPEPLLSAASTAPTFQDVPVGLPSEVLTRRPDIRQAEQQLIAANANIGAARAAFFPRISLTAFAGSASSDLNNLFKSGTWGWSLAPQAVLPIFDGGRNRANLESAKAGRDIAVAQYEKAIQTAFRDVADTLAGRATLGEQLQAQEAQARAEAERVRLAELRFQSGVASSLDLLDAQRALYAAQQQAAQIRLAQQQNRVALYKALGGGWKAPAEPVAQR